MTFGVNITPHNCNKKVTNKVYQLNLEHKTSIYTVKNVTYYKDIKKIHTFIHKLCYHSPFLLQNVVLVNKEFVHIRKCLMVFYACVKILSIVKLETILEC